MSSKIPLITVVEEDDMDSIHDLDKMQLKPDYNPKLSQSMLPQSFSNSESELDDDSESDNENNLDMPDDNIDPNDTLEPSRPSNDEEEGSFRGRPSSCVFVASLAANLTDDELSISVTKHFQQWGELALVKVLRDPSNRPYAFVQYTTDEDALQALKEGQHSTLDGRTIRCEQAKVNRTLYVATANGKDANVRTVKDVLDKFGEIEQFIGNNDSTFRKSNLNKAWFCKFAYRDDAIRAYANLRLSPEWIVEWAQNIDHPSDPFDKTESDVVIDKFSIFIGQLDGQVSKEKLNERFSRHGKICEISLVLRTGNNFAFIKFATEKAAAAAVERENHAVFMDKTMHVQYREMHHKKSKYSNTTSPRLSLAPPPVNLPYRRASTGSGFNYPKTNESARQYVLPNVYQSNSSNHHKTNRSNRYNIGSRAVSFNSNDRAFLRFHTPLYGNEIEYDIIGGSPVIETDGYSPTEKNTPVSSPSNNTVNSANGEAKSVYSSSTISALDHNLQDDSTNPTTSGYGTSKFLHRSSSHLVSQNVGATLIQRPPSSYYYYALPKENYVYDQSSFVPYASYPYYFSESSLVDFPQSAVSSAGHIKPAPYYMYYSVPQSYNEKSGFNEQQYHDESKHEEMNY